MPGSKFAASRRHGKTPSICRKAVQPKPDTIPDSSHPIIHPRPLLASIQWKSINPGHPWHYADTHILYWLGGTLWRSVNSYDPDFTLSISVRYVYSFPWYAAWSTINHQAHGDHLAASSVIDYAHGAAFHVPRFQLNSSPYPRYQCYLCITV